MTRTSLAAAPPPHHSAAERVDDRPARVEPTVPLVLAVVLGVVADRQADALGGLTSSRWLGLAVVAGGAGLILGRVRGAGLLCTLVAWAALAGAWHHARWSDHARDDLALTVSDVPRAAWLRGVVLDVPGYRPGRGDDEGITRAVVELFAASENGAWRAVSGRALANLVGDLTHDVQPGEAVELVGALARPAGPLNPGEFDYRAFLRAQGIGLRLTVEDRDGLRRLPPSETTALAAPGSWRWRVAGWLGRVRAWSQERLARGLEPDSVPLAAALLLGRREGVDPDVNDAFARTGTTHLLAISGLHLQVLAVGLGLVLRGLGVPRRAALLAVGTAAFGYAALVGLMPSVVRSVAMTVTACGAGILDRRSRPANTLALAALATLLLNPAHLFDAGCQLSFVAVAAIAWGVEPTRAWLRPEPDALTRAERYFQPRWRHLARRISDGVVEGMIVSVVVWLVAAPLVLLRFHIAAPIGILLNVPLIPITSIALLAAGVSLGLSAIWEPLGVPAGMLCSALLNLTERLVRWGAGLGWGHAFGPSPSWPWVLGFYLLLGLSLVARYRGQGRVWCRVLAGLTLATMPLGTLAMLGVGRPARMEADVLAVGHGLAVGIDLGGGRAWLYDCGRMRDPSVGRRIVAPALWERGVWRIESVILSHADADHYNGLPDLLHRFSIGEVVVPVGFENDPGAASLLAGVARHGVPIRTAIAGDTAEAGPFALRVRHPPRDWSAARGDNDRSLVVDLAPRARKPADRPHLWLTGDLDGAGLSTVADGYDERRDGPVGLLLAPHHGGRTANPLGFYEQIDPGGVVVSQRMPPSGTFDALQLIEERGYSVARTWQRGALTLRWIGAKIEIQGTLDE